MPTVWLDSDAMTTKILTRILKLKALAKDQAGRPEGETAAELMRKMMLDHSIEEVDLAAADREPDPNIRHDVDLGQRSRWRRYLMANVADYCELTMTHYIRSSKGSFWGRASGCVIAEHLMTVLAREIERAADAYMQTYATTPAEPGFIWESPKTVRFEFCFSAVSAVAAKLAKIKQKLADANAAGNALVVSRKADADAFMHATVTGLRKERLPPVFHSQPGYEAGARISIDAAIAADRDGGAGSSKRLGAA